MTEENDEENLKLSEEKGPVFCNEEEEKRNNVKTR